MCLVQARAGGKSRQIAIGRHGVVSADQARRKGAQMILGSRPATGWKLFVATGLGNIAFASTNNGVSASSGVMATPGRSRLSTITRSYIKHDH